MLLLQIKGLTLSMIWLWHTPTSLLLNFESPISSMCCPSSMVFISFRVWIDYLPQKLSSDFYDMQPFCRSCFMFFFHGPFLPFLCGIYFWFGLFLCGHIGLRSFYLFFFYFYYNRCQLLYLGLGWFSLVFLVYF